MADLVVVDYEAVSQIAKQCEQLMTRTQQISNLLTRHVTVLKQRGWISDAAEAFFAEYEHKIAPGMKRLDQAFQATTETLKVVSQIYREAEERAAALFNGLDSSTSSGTTGGVGKPDFVGRYTNANGSVSTVPLYHLDVDNPNFNANEFLQRFNPDRRPILTVAHGWNVNDSDARAQFEQMSKDYARLYAHLPEKDRPIIIGVDWDSSVPDVSGAAFEGGVRGAALGASFGAGNPASIAGGAVRGAVGGAISETGRSYYEGQANLKITGPRVGRVLEQIQQRFPESPLNIIAHSAGNPMMMEAIQSNDLNVNRMFSVQPAVDRADVSYGGRFDKMLNPDVVNNWASTYNHGDKAMWAHYIAGDKAFSSFDTPMGYDSRYVPRSDIKHYDMSVHNPWHGLALNHSNFNDEYARENVVDFFGADGSGFRR